MRSPSEKLKFGLWWAGVLAVFLFHVAALVGAAAGGGEQSALVWSILLLIAAPVSVVGLIGLGLVLSGRGGDEGGDGPETRTKRDR